MPQVLAGRRCRRQ